MKQPEPNTISTVDFKREITNLEGGEAVFQYPATLSQKDAEYVEEWMCLIIKKIKRRTSKHSEDSSSTSILDLCPLPDAKEDDDE